jgi:hypothetical protein
MLNARKFQIIGATVLIIAAALVIISASKPAAVDLSWPPRPNFSVLNEKVDLSWPPRPDFSVLNQKGISPFAGDQGYAPRHSLVGNYTLVGSGNFAGDRGYAPRHR